MGPDEAESLNQLVYPSIRYPVAQKSPSVLFLMPCPDACVSCQACITNILRYSKYNIASSNKLWLQLSTVG